MKDLCLDCVVFVLAVVPLMIFFTVFILPGICGIGLNLKVSGRWERFQDWVADLLNSRFVLWSWLLASIAMPRYCLPQISKIGLGVQMTILVVSLCFFLHCFRPNLKEKWRQFIGQFEL